MKTVKQVFDLHQLQQMCIRLASELVAGDCILLDGPLGSGKTQMVKLLADALKCDDPVTSPTYGLANFYRTSRMPILHIDTYRLSSREEFHQLGLDEYFDTHLTLVEWGEKVQSDFEIPLHVQFSFSGQGGDKAGEKSGDTTSHATEDSAYRRLIFSWQGSRWDSAINHVVKGA